MSHVNVCYLKNYLHFFKYILIKKHFSVYLYSTTSE